MAGLNVVTSITDYTMSYDIDKDTFVHGDIAVSSNGVYLRNSPKKFQLNPRDLIIGEIIGKGASSIVKQAFHKPTQTYLALKTLNVYDKSKRDQLIKEIQGLYYTVCPSIITFYGAYYEDGRITIALEFMNGGSLDNVLAQVGWVPDRALAGMMFQVLWGLAYLRTENRLHRDIKPSNILINSEGETKLTDFGISRDLKRSVAYCNTFVGTLRYMAPERINNDPYTYASEIWALGVVLIQCATGEYPYKCEFANIIECAQTLLENPSPALPVSYPPFCKLHRRQSKTVYFSRHMRDFVRRCVAQPQKRATAEELLAHDWMRLHGITNCAQAVCAVKEWIAKRGRCC